MTTTAVQGVSVSVAAIPGLSANFARPGDFTIPIYANVYRQLGGKSDMRTSDCILPDGGGSAGEAVVTVTDSAGDTLTFNVNGTGAILRCASARTAFLPYVVAH